jgi:predicted signal transduction protein with EAL and GGDEF domain
VNLNFARLLSLKIRSPGVNCSVWRFFTHQRPLFVSFVWFSCWRLALFSSLLFLIDLWLFVGVFRSAAALLTRRMKHRYVDFGCLF